MGTGRPRSRYPDNADVHGRVREARFDVPPTMPPDPRPDDPARFDDLPLATREALTAWVGSALEPDAEPLIDDLTVLRAFRNATDHDVPIGAIRAAMHNAGYLTPFRDLNAGRRWRFKARLVG